MGEISRSRALLTMGARPHTPYNKAQKERCKRAALFRGQKLGCISERQGQKVNMGASPHTPILLSIIGWRKRRGAGLAENGRTYAPRQIGFFRTYGRPASAAPIIRVCFPQEAGHGNAQNERAFANWQAGFRLRMPAFHLLHSSHSGSPPQERMPDCQLPHSLQSSIVLLPLFPQ